MTRLKNKRGRKSKYQKSLNNEYHREVRRRTLIRDEFRCRYPGCGSKLFLELHHIKYYIKGESIIGKELEDDNMKWVVIVCASHHQTVHKNKNHQWNPKNKFAECIKN